MGLAAKFPDPAVPAPEMTVSVIECSLDCAPMITSASFAVESSHRENSGFVASGLGKRCCGLNGVCLPAWPRCREGGSPLRRRKRRRNALPNLPQALHQTVILGERRKLHYRRAWFLRLDGDVIFG